MNIINYIQSFNYVSKINLYDIIIITWVYIFIIVFLILVIWSNVMDYSYDSHFLDKNNNKPIYINFVNTSIIRLDYIFNIIVFYVLTKRLIITGSILKPKLDLKNICND
jgi:hypothetical protein